MRRLRSFLLLALTATIALTREPASAATAAVPANPATLIRDALAAEAKLDTRRALDLFLAAEKAKPNDAFLFQKIARQYSDLVVDLATNEEKKRSVQRALEYAQRAVALAPNDPVNVLSLAVCHGKLGVYGDTRTKIENSRLVKDEAERALALDPNYAWAHHVLGRWNYEVADVGATARFFVRLIYGGLPSASTAEAVRHLERAVALEPGELDHHLELGFAHLANGNTGAARACFEKGLAMPSRGKHDEPAKARARAALEKLGPAQ